MGEMKNAYKIVIEKLEGKRSFEYLDIVERLY
jgi:hypothetical protein